MIKIRSLKDSDEGVAGVIVAVLMIGLLVSGIAFIQSIYVPEWMEQKEAEHMDNIATQFSQLKYSIDTLSVTSQSNSQISTPITLGSDKLPFLKSMRSYGSINVLPNYHKIRIDDKNGEKQFYILGSVKYSSTNSYYIDQDYFLENGALIQNQNSKQLMLIDPAFSVIDAEDLELTLIKFTGIGIETSASGYGTYPIKAKFIESDSMFINNVENITIYTNNIVAWKLFFDKELSKSDINYTIDENLDNNSIKIAFYETEEVDLPDLDLIVNSINIQISPGWGN
jgi:hypothetical protein